LPAGDTILLFVRSSRARFDHQPQRLLDQLQLAWRVQTPVEFGSIIILTSRVKFSWLSPSSFANSGGGHVTHALVFTLFRQPHDFLGGLVGRFAAKPKTTLVFAASTGRIVNRALCNHVGPQRGLVRRVRQSEAYYYHIRKSLVGMLAPRSLS
jgi:hypothetical protein